MWATIDQRHHVHAERVLQLRLLVEVIEDDLRHFTALQLNHQAHAGFVRFVLDVSDTLDLFLVDQFGNLFLQGLLVDLIGQLIDDDGLATGILDLFEVGACAHDDAAAPSQVTIAHAGNSIDQAGSRKVWRRNNFDQLFNIEEWVIQQRLATVEYLVEVMWRDVGCHPYRDTRTAIDQQVRDACRQDQRFMLGAIVVRAKVTGFLVDISQQLVADPRHAHFGISHGRRVITVDRAKVSLAIDQHVAQGKMLRHADDRVIDRRIAMRVVLTDDITDDTRGLLVSLVPVVVQFVHGEQHPPMHGFQAITGIRQRPPDDYAHGVIEVGMAHFLFEADGDGFFGEGSGHKSVFTKIMAHNKACDSNMGRWRGRRRSQHVVSR